MRRRIHKKNECPVLESTAIISAAAQQQLQYTASTRESGCKMSDLTRAQQRRDESTGSKQYLFIVAKYIYSSVLNIIVHHIP